MWPAAAKPFECNLFLVDALEMDIEHNAHNTTMNGHIAGHHEHVRDARGHKGQGMHIFKDECNCKLSSFKEANQELSHSNVKASEEIGDFRTRLSKKTQQKTELKTGWTSTKDSL